MTEQQHYEEIEALAKRFSELSYHEAPQEDVMKAFNEWQEYLDNSGLRKPEVKNGSSSTVITNQKDRINDY